MQVRLAALGYYDVKLDATKLLLSNTANTFTTAVFSGSASLRDAAGYMIEDAVKSTRRGKTVDEPYLQTLFSETQALYRLGGEYRALLAPEYAERLRGGFENE